jgi:hypothetical protein
MQFFSTLLFSALAALAAANSVHFINQDSTTRTIVFTAQEGLEKYASITIPGFGTADQTFATGWIGNWYAVSEGAADVPGMLGEVRFDGFAGQTYYDVSAIVNPNDTNGVKEIFPASTNAPVSGCATFPCAHVYVQSDDVQTQASSDSSLVCTLGTATTERRWGAVARSFVEN